VSSAFLMTMLPSAVEDAIGLSESGTGSNHLPRRSRSRAAVPAPPSATEVAPTEGGRVLWTPSSPKDRLNACRRARVVVPLKWDERNPASVNRPSTVTGAGAPIASFTGCSSSAGGPAFPSEVIASYPYRGEKKWLARIRRVRLSEASATSPEIKGGLSLCDV